MTQQNMPPLVPDYGRADSTKPSWRGIIGWVIFIGLAFVFFLLLQARGGGAPPTEIALSDFLERLEVGDVAYVEVSGDTVAGAFVTPQTIGGVAVMRFESPLPPGMGSDWQFIHWMMQNRGGASISVVRQDGLLVNVLIPLIPWVLIFAFIWFFVYRGLRMRHQEPLRVQVVERAEDGAQQG